MPKTSIRSHPNPQCFDSSIRHQINCLRTLRRKHKSHPSPSKSSKINLLEQQLPLRISLAKYEFESKLLLSLHSNGMSNVFKYIRNVTGQNKNPNTVHLGDIFAQSDLNKANLVNSYFHSVFTKSSFCCPNPRQLPDINPKLGHLSITEEVFRSLAFLDPSKATGCDGIGPRLLKHCVLALCQPLHHRFNLCISQSYIPAEWHLHLIKPLF